MSEKTINADNFEVDNKKEASYRRLVNPEVMDELKDKILQQLVVHKRYRDRSYTARQLAEDLNTNTRYISAAIRVQFHTNYTALVNKMRVEEAMSKLADSRYADLSVEEIGELAGFAHRQSFHTAFMRFAGTTPKAYRTQFDQDAGQSKKNNKKKQQ